MKKIIIHGTSLAAVQAAIEAKNSGDHPVLIGKYGFPGGNLVEVLDLKLPKEGHEEQKLVNQFYAWAQDHKSALLADEKDYFVVHPEYLKRFLWELIEELDIEFLFHVIILKVEQTDQRVNVKLFGRQGELELSADRFLEFNQSLENLNRVNLIVERSLLSLNSGNVIFQQSTPLGIYHQIELNQTLNDEREFNQQLNVLISELMAQGNQPVLLPVLAQKK